MEILQAVKFCNNNKFKMLDRDIVYEIHSNKEVFLKFNNKPIAILLHMLIPHQF